jgi:hypothetical protein
MATTAQTSPAPVQGHPGFGGDGKYFDHRPTEQVVRDERRRENGLMEAGRTVIRIGWSDVFNEHLSKTRPVAALRKGGAR